MSSEHVDKKQEEVVDCYICAPIAALNPYDGEGGGLVVSPQFEEVPGMFFESQPPDWREDFITLKPLLREWGAFVWFMSKILDGYFEVLPEHYAPECNGKRVERATPNAYRICCASREKLIQCMNMLGLEYREAQDLDSFLM